MLLLIEYARTMMDDNECVVLYYEPVRRILRFNASFDPLFRLEL